MDFYKDDLGHLRARSEKHHRYVVDFLEENVRGRVEACDFFIRMLESVRDGSDEPGDGAGDALGYSIDRETVKLWHLWDGSGEVGSVDIGEFIDLLKAWRREIGG